MNTPYELSKKAMKKIKEYDHSPTPEVYTVWYEYFAGYLLKLKKEIDEKMNKGYLISEDHILELYKKYFVGNFDEQ